MPFAPQTWTMLQAIQTLIQLNLLVNDSNNPITPASPFSPFTTADAALYAAPNLGGATPTAIYIGVPPDWRTSIYPRQCHIIPPAPENVYRRALGGKIWDESHILVEFCYNRTGPGTPNWYTNTQDLLAARDAAYVFMEQHAQMPNAPTVQASKMMPAGNNSGYGHLDLMQGESWDTWSFVWWLKQEWTVQGGIIP